MIHFKLFIQDIKAALGKSSRFFLGSSYGILLNIAVFLGTFFAYSSCGFPWTPTLENTIKFQIIFLLGGIIIYFIFDMMNKYIFEDEIQPSKKRA